MNTNSSDYSSPFYNTQAYTTTTTLAWSTQVNSMPITTFQVSVQPCMNPQDQEGAAFYINELNANTKCPQEINSGLYYDPNYVKLDAFSTTEYAV